MARDATRTRENEDELDQIKRIYLDLAISKIFHSPSLLPPLFFLLFFLCQYPYRPQSKMLVRISSSVKNASLRIILNQKCQYPYRPQSKMPVRVSSSVKNASTRIVLSRKCKYPYRPQSDMLVCVSSSVKNASIRIVLSQKSQYPYRPQSKMPVPVWSSVGHASTRIDLSLKCKYPYRHTNTDTGVTDVRVMAFCQYGHGRIKDRTRIVLS